MAYPTTGQILLSRTLAPAAAVSSVQRLLARNPETVRRVYDLVGAVAMGATLRVFTVERAEVVMALADRIRLRLPAGLAVTVTPEGEGTALLEISAAVSKATGLGRLADLSGIRPSEVIAAGDNLNDLEMLAYAGYAVAMGNAHPAVKAVANFVTGSNEEDGVAEFLEQFLFQAA